jgi:hypothetical protein
MKRRCCKQLPEQIRAVASAAVVSERVLNRRRAWAVRLRNCIVAAGAAACLAAASARANFGDELFKLTASDAAARDNFGWSVAISGNTAIVGSPGNSDAGGASGSAYIVDATTGSELWKLTASDAAAGDSFGFSVAIDGTTAIVGADLNDDGGLSSGSAYLFDASTGTQLWKLTASDAAETDFFGHAVAINGNTALVGSYSDNTPAGDNAGSAFVFNATTGTQLRKLTAADGAAEDRFGWSVAISGNVALIGSPRDDDDGGDSGAAYVINASTGAQLRKLTASDAAAGDEFGYSVRISGNLAIIGAPFDDDGGNSSGSAYLFDLTTGDELFKLTAADDSAGDEFGSWVGISGNSAIVGAHFDDDAGGESGSAYLFDAITGNQLFKLTAADAAADDNFGRSVGISGSIAIVGSHLNDDDGIDSGSAYLLSAVPEPTTLTLLALATVTIFGWRGRRTC